MSRRGSRIAILCAWLAVLSGCAVHATRSYDAASAKAPAHGPPPETFAYEQDARTLKEESLPQLSTPTHRARGLTWASAGDNGQPEQTVTAEYFQSKQPGKHPLVIVLPLWGSYTYPPDKIAEGVRDRDAGTHVLRVLGENYLFDWDAVGASTDAQMLHARTSAMSERMRVTVIDVRRLLDWAEQQPEIDAGRIGIVGFSMSAIVGGLVAGADERPHAVVLVMGGADLHDIIAHCDGPLQRVRDEVVPRLGLTDEQYLAITEDAWGWINPAHFPTRVDPGRIIMFEAGRDECMPQSARDAFWETLGRPTRVTFRYGHKQSFLAMTPLGFNYLRRSIYNFLDVTLSGY